MWQQISGDLLFTVFCPTHPPTQKKSKILCVVFIGHLIEHLKTKCSEKAYDK